MTDQPAPRTPGTLPGTGPFPDAWRERFLLELRLRGVPGERIGDALAQVDTHCAESGGTPLAAFGPPEAYAAALAPSLAPEGARADPWWGWGLLGGSVGGGALLLLAGLRGVVEGAPARLGVGALLVLVLVTAGSCVVEPVLRLLTRPRRSATIFLAVFGVLLGQSALSAAFPDAALRLPAWPALGVGTALLLAGLGRALRMTPDRVVDPRTGREAWTVPRWAGLVVGLALPVLLLAAVVVTVVLPSSR